MSGCDPREFRLVDMAEPASSIPSQRSLEAQPDVQQQQQPTNPLATAEAPGGIDGMLLLSILLP